MPALIDRSNYQWLCTGKDTFSAMFAAIAEAKENIQLEMYIFAPGPLGERFRDALTAAAARGVRVQVLVDALGSLSLPSTFWQPLISAGGDARQFNPFKFNRLSIRNHRKLLVCDDRVAFLGGFNIAPEYDGDGVASGWCDVGLRVEGPVVLELRASFDDMFHRAALQHRRFLRVRKTTANKVVSAPQWQLLLSGPGRISNPFTKALRMDLRNARDVQIIVAYFLPGRRLRRALAQVARSGGRVQLLLPGKSDIALSRLAAQSLYRRLLKAGVEIYEYQPQILHAKLFIIDGIVMAGSSNLDPRSVSLNYELMLRLESSSVAAAAREIFARKLELSKRITGEEWRRSRSWWRKLTHRWAYFVLAQVDPYIARRQWRGLPD